MFHLKTQQIPVRSPKQASFDRIVGIFLGEFWETNSRLEQAKRAACWDPVLNIFHWELKINENKHRLVNLKPNAKRSLKIDFQMFLTSDLS